MTWKRVATAVVLIPFVVGLVVWGSTAIVALAVALVTLLALFEYFALGEAIGHRAYRFWTAGCALLLIFLQWIASTVNVLTRGTYTFLIYTESGLSRVLLTPHDAFFLFVLGIAAITLSTRRPLVETLPAAGISCSGLLLVAFPLSYAVRLHGLKDVGPLLLLFALVITWVGDSAAYFVGRAIGKHPFAPHLSPKKTWEGAVASFVASVLVGFIFGRWIFIPLPTCWRWRRWAMWQGRLATFSNRRISAARGSRIPAVFCPVMGAFLTESTRSSSPFRLSGIIGY